MNELAAKKISNNGGISEVEERRNEGWRNLERRSGVIHEDG